MTRRVIVAALVFHMPKPGSICFVNIYKEVRTKTWKHIEFGKKDCMTDWVSGLWDYIRLGMVSVKTPLDLSIET